jgi:hypothetical protein
MEEPYGRFGAMNPTGHAAVYLNHVCAQSPTALRPCRSGEPGVVISRYNKVGGYDWIAIPLIPYLYSVESVSDIPTAVSAEEVSELRDAYRRAHLLHIAPDNDTGGAPDGNWIELVGESFNRTIHGFEIETTPEQDQVFIAIFNDRKNATHFNLLFHNCADFSRIVFNTYLPHSIHRNFIADVGFMTPKQVARSLIAYSRKNPSIHMTTFVIPQIPGTLPRSHAVDGVVESVIKSKKYVLPLAIVSPEVTGAVVVAYLVDGRLSLPKNAPILAIGAPDPGDSQQPAAKPPYPPRRISLEPAAIAPSQAAFQP